MICGSLTNTTSCDAAVTVIYSPAPSRFSEQTQKEIVYTCSTLIAHQMYHFN